MEFFKLLLVFAPWLAFLFIAQGSLFRLKLGLVVALVLSIVLGLARVHRGIILWVGLVFFSVTAVAVVGYENPFFERHMGIFASGALAFATWLSLVLRKPFTLDYAREHTPPSLWNDPTFIETNVRITGTWGLAFTMNAVLAWGKMEHVLLPDWGYETVSYGLLLVAVLASVWYPKHVRRQRQARQ
jgi:hypothetical protein